MDFDEEDNCFFGSFPEFGAIFMSSVEHMKECFKRKVFALPPSMAKFVQHVKSGMVLFLFECKKRQLFGVYKASSDGAMDIVPDGFNYYGRHYPAQVRFKPLWDCEPLSEKEFRDAIRDNYFSAKKFKFGLSKDQVRLDKLFSACRGPFREFKPDVLQVVPISSFLLQVHRLLNLFSSRKLLNRISHHPLRKPNVEVAWKDRSSLMLSERGYMEQYENNEFRPAAFCDHHLNLFNRVKEDELLEDDRISTEGKMHYCSTEDFLAKRRGVGNAEKFITSGMEEKSIYNKHTKGIMHSVFPMVALDEVRRSVNDRRLSPVERINKNQTHNILDRSGCLVDPLDVRANDDLAFMQSSRLLHEYKMHNGSGQAFESGQYEVSLDTIKCPGQRDYDPHETATHVAYVDNNMNLRRPARGWTNDRECLMNRKLKYRYHLDCQDSPMHKFRNGDAAGVLPFNEIKPDFCEGSSEGFPSGKSSPPFGHRNIHDRSYPIVEQRLNENMAERNVCSTNPGISAGYPGVDRCVVGDKMLRNIKKSYNEGDRHMCNNLGPSMECLSSSLEKNLSSLSDKLFTEKSLHHPHSTYVDATFTNVAPYSPEHPGLSHGYFPSRTSHQDSSLMRENNPCHYSLGDFCLRSKDRLPQDILDPGNCSGPMDIALESGNNCSPLLNESTRSFLNHCLPVQLDPRTSVPVNYEGSFSPKLSSQHTDLENIGENGLFGYLSQSRKLHFTTASCVDQHVNPHEINIFANKDLSCSKSKDSSHGDSRLEREVFYNRRSVFSRLTSKEESEFDEETNNTDYNHPDRYMHATVNAVMESLQRNENLSERNLLESRVGRPLTNGEYAVHEKKIQHIEANHSKTQLTRLNNASSDAANGLDDMPNETRVVKFKCHSERKKIHDANEEANHSMIELPRLNDASPAAVDGIGDMPNETRVVSFKRRSETKKISGANEEVKNSAKSTMKRRKLVRPDFSKKTGSATDAICNNDTSHTPTPIPDKVDKQIHETVTSCGQAELSMSIDNFHPPTDCNSNEPQNPEEQKVVVAQEFPPTSLELKGLESTNTDIHNGSSEVFKETIRPRSSEIQVSAEVINTTIPDLNLPGSCTEGSNLGEAKNLKTKGEKVIKRTLTRISISS